MNVNKHTELEACLSHWRDLSTVEVDSFSGVFQSNAPIANLGSLRKFLSTISPKEIEGLWACTASDAVSCIRGISLGAVGSPWKGNGGVTPITTTPEARKLADQNAYITIAQLCGKTDPIPEDASSDMSGSSPMFEGCDFYVADNDMSIYDDNATQTRPWQLVIACVRPQKQFVALLCISHLPWTEDVNE